MYKFLFYFILLLLYNKKMRNKNNIILKTGNRALISGSGLHRRGLLVDVRDHLKNVHHEKTIVNNPTYGRIISSKKMTTQ